MISRVVEAKPEELRIFLEEAAGVSKYKERRKETEGRLSDARENLARVEDIRTELATQLAKLEHQARVATEYRQHEARLKQTQHLLWFSKQQDAARSRERAANEVATLTVALEALQAEARSIEARIESQRTEHYAAGDALHERQGGFYAANAEVTRLEQQLAFARENESRIGRDVAQITEQVAALATQADAIAGDRAGLETSLAQAITVREAAAVEERDAQAALPALERSLADASAAFAEIDQHIIQSEQAIRVAETRRENATRTLAQIEARRAALTAEIDALAAPVNEGIEAVSSQLEQESSELTGRSDALTALQERVQQLQERQRSTSLGFREDSRKLADLQAREQALSALQARVGHGQDKDAWLARTGLDNAVQLWRALDVDRGWNDALEATLRDRLEALEVDALDVATAWEAPETSPPVRLSVFVPAAARHAPEAVGDALLGRVRLKRPELGRLLADALHGVRCRDSLADAIADRHSLGVGESFVTPAGHGVSAQTVTLFKPDGDLHGVLERQRELEALADSTRAAAEVVAVSRAALEELDSELESQQQAYHAESAALTSQQRRVHDLELELVQLKQAAEVEEKRRAALVQDRVDADLAAEAERAQREAIVRELADLQSELHDAFARRDAARHVRNEAEVARERGRERLRVAERAAQEAGFDESRVRDRLAELERRNESLRTATQHQQTLLAQLTSERQAVDLTPVEQALQRQLGVRSEAETALAAARDALESLGATLRASEEARLGVEQKLDPSRQRIQDMQLKVQAATLAEQQFADQLAEAHAEVDRLPEALKAFGNKSQLPGEIERLQQAIAELGAVNLAALDELETASERKRYLDAQAADLTEAMATLEAAIRQIDRESRELLQQTFDAVNVNFGKLFPTLFGGGHARLVLTGDEILDSGVQVVAQPPGKRNTSIHLLSGGEKALTATSLVFALFQLNPAPFCLLDEVDAPLDDTNTERFCQMVGEMAAETQFLFISHNKITMEMAHQLIGITMPEPGISRVVAVDIAEAVELAVRQGPATAAASAPSKPQAKAAA